LDSVVVDVDAQAAQDLAHGNDGNNNNSTDNAMAMDLKERAASATPTIAKPDFTYPPYGVTTIYVKSISTSTYTYEYLSMVYETLPDVTTTTSYMLYTMSTVTVTRTP
jgi:hypothetical protein